jgi:hypothetical protein
MGATSRRMALYVKMDAAKENCRGNSSLLNLVLHEEPHIET